jgi:hypothetical protein
MNINEFLKPVDNLFTSINDNKGTLLLILILLGIYITQFNEYIVQNTTYLFDNNLFKFIFFILITYISGSSPAIGISLAIIMLVSMQIITSLKLKKDIQNENFSQMNPVDMSYLNDEYLTNPLEMQKDLSPSIDLDLKLVTPTDYYMQMIKKGKVLLDDSYDLEQDLSKRFDIREKEIASITKKNGTELVDSGINRLQKADQGEYNLDGLTKLKTNKFIKYSKLLENISNNPSIVASYNELLYNYNKLVVSQLDEKNFNIQLNKVYMSELELLETIYRIKKNKISEDKQKIIEKEFNKIKQLKAENKDWTNELKSLTILIEFI